MFCYTIFTIIIFLVGISPGFAQTPEEYTIMDPQNDDVEYPIHYGVNGTTIEDMNIYPQHTSIVVTLTKAAADGNFTIKLPRGVIDAKNGTSDEKYLVLVDNSNTGFNETKTDTDRTIVIPFSKGAKQIEIIGTQVIPEFGGLSYMVFLIAIFLAIFLSVKSSHRIKI